MPDYTYKAPDGTVFTLRGDSPATEEELEQVYASLKPSQSPGITPEELRSQARAGAGQFPEEKISEYEKTVAQSLPFIRAATGPILGEIISRTISTPGSKLQERAQSEALSRGILRTITGGLFDPFAEKVISPISERVLGTPEFETRTQFGPERFAPEAGFLGEIAGSALPAGEFASPATTGLQVIGRGARMGGVLGAGAGVAESFQQPELEPSVGEIFEKGIKGAATGAAIGAVIPTIPQISKKAVEKLPRIIEGFKRLPTTNDDLLTFVSGADNAGKVFMERVNSGFFNDVLPEISRLKKQSGSKGLELAVDLNTKETLDIVNPIIRNADPNKEIFQAENILNRTRENLSREIRTPEVAERSLKSVQRDYLTGLTPNNITDRYRDISSKVRSLHKSPDQARVSDRLKALESARQTLSENVKILLDEAGFDPGIWGRHGKISEIGNRISERHGQELSAYRALRGEGWLGKSGADPSDLLNRVPLLGTIVRGTRNIKDRFTGGTPALLDKRIDQLFSRIDPGQSAVRQPPVIPPASLTPEQIQAQRIAQSIQQTGVP